MADASTGTRRWRLAAILLVLGLGGGPGWAQQTSGLWGENGELWSPAGRLPDFSFAGYHCGEDPLPEVPVACDVRDFGAVGDGEHDDTQAFRQAIAHTDAGAIRIPPGRYRITDILWIEKPGVVLRGAGPEQTVLFFPGFLEEVRPNMGATTSGQPTSNYSWSGGFLWVKGSQGSRPLTGISSEAARGARSFRVADPAGLKVGQRVMVEVTDDGPRSLQDHLYGGDPGDTQKITKPIQTRLVSRIQALDGDRVTLERTLRFDLRPEWKPVLASFEPTVREVGIEGLTCEFPARPYQGHFTELGANAIALNNVADCWVRDVRIRNADSGVFASGTFCTVTGLVLESERPAHRGTTGHHGVTFGMDCLLEEFDFRTHFIHDITLSYGHAGNVAKNGRGVNLSLDHHKKANHANLFCNLDAGDGSDLWRCGGGASLGRHCGAWGTFWAIRTARPVSWPPRAFGPDLMNLVGLNTESATVRDPDGRWLEAIPPEQLAPADLHAAQLARRLAPRPARLPEGAGLAAKYPGDRGIEEDGAVLFADGFEDGTLGRWGEDQTGGDEGRCAVTRDPAQAFFGEHACRMTATRGKDDGAGLIQWLEEGQDELYARFYVRFAADAGYTHHFVHVNGATERWGSFGKAGIRPTGEDFFTTGIEPDPDWGRNPPPGRWMFYTYWPDMRASPDGKHWGNGFHPEAFVIPRDRWICMEVRVRLNTPGEEDGEQSVWQDGRLIGHFTGFRWRTTERLKANVFWLMSYVTERAFANTEQHAPKHAVEASTETHTVWFDQVVVAKEYIGPLQAGKKE